MFSLGVYSYHSFSEDWRICPAFVVRLSSCCLLQKDCTVLYCTYSTVDHPPFYNDCAHNSLTVQYRELQHWYCAIPGLYPDCEISVAMLEPIAICSVDLGYSTLPAASFSKPLKGDKGLCITLIWRREQRTVWISHSHRMILVT